MGPQPETYTFRRSGTTGCEILDLDGVVIAWTIDELWAAVICRLLSTADADPIVWDQGPPDSED